MTPFRPHRPALAALVILAGCGDGSGPGGAALSCDDVAPTALAPGQLALADASETACVRLAEGGAEGAEYLYLAYSAATEETRDGTSADYLLAAEAGEPAPTTVRDTPRQGISSRATAASSLHDHLRVMDREAARRSTRPRAARRRPPALVVPPVVGDQRTFHVLRSATSSGTDEDDFVQVAGTARYVGARVAIFLDDAAPTEGGYTPDDLAAIGSLFDDYLHPIDVDAFGAETDVNGDGMVLVLLTDRVTRLAGCGNGQVVVGLFFAVDLFADLAGSNDAEIFYGLTPDEACGVDRERAIDLLPSVFIHEFQHMINYGQKVIERDGDAEDIWLDEGLSGLAEELGGRLVPDERCIDGDCVTQFHAGNLANAYDYLRSTDDAYLIGPRRPPLPLTQYGATWLFVRWLADHFAADPTLGTDLTRTLVQTTLTGAANVAAATDTPFEQLIGEWQVANYLAGRDDLAELTDGTPFGYTSWDLPAIFASFSEDDPDRFPRAYPLEPDVFSGSEYLQSGALRAGSGHHLLVEQPAGSSVDLLLTDPDGTSPISSDAGPHTVLLRLR